VRDSAPVHLDIGVIGSILSFADTGKPTAVVALCSPVRILLMPCRPATVARLVVTAIIDAIKGSSGRTLAHVGQEGREGSTPAGADLDVVRAVMGEGWAAVVLTAGDLRPPRSVKFVIPH
jgi:hypothetical protein